MNVRYIVLPAEVIRIGTKLSISRLPSETATPFTVTKGILAIALLISCLYVALLKALGILVTAYLL
jgi:hypothetical protein